MTNDTVILISLATIFILFGITLPFLQDAFGQTVVTNDADNLANQLSEEKANVNVVTASTIFFSILKMFFWTFGALPFVIDLVFLVLRVIFFFIVVRNIPGLGSGG